MHLVDPNLDALRGQTIYLDFDGAKGVDYNGPVPVKNIDVPVFQAPSNLAGQERAIVASVLGHLAATFGNSGVVFTAEQAGAGTLYSTVYVGGDGSAFRHLGDITSVAEQIDVGNRNTSDNAIVFSDFFVTGASTLDEAANNLTLVVSHEVGHILGYVHTETSSEAGVLANVADTYKLTWNTTNSMTINPITKANHTFIVDGVFATRYTRWYVNGSYIREDVSNLLNGYWDPTYDCNFSSASGTITILAKEYTGSGGSGFVANHTWTCTVGAPEMDVQGNGYSIADGDTSPSTTDYTDFGSVSVASGSVTRTFTIKNTGNIALNLTGSPRVSISGSSDFTVTSQPSSPVSATTGSTTLQIKFDPSSAGMKTATVSISNDDSNENPYNFSIQGMGTQVTGLSWRSGSSSGSSTITTREAGQTVYLGATATGMSGQTINVTIYEDDGIDFDDDYGTKAITFDSSGWGSTSWTTDWDNGDSWSPYQTYYFYYTSQSLYSGNLVLTDTTAPFAPTGLAVSPTSGPTTTRTFSWGSTTDNPSNTLGSGFKEFVLKVDGTEKYRGTATSRDLSGLSSGDHTWLVEAWDNNGRMSSTNGRGSPWAR